MSSVFWSKNTDEMGESVLTFTLPSGEPKIINQSHPSFNGIVAALVQRDLNPDATSDEEFENYLSELLSPIRRVLCQMTTLGETSRVSISGGTVFFDNDPIDNSITQYIVRALQHDAKVSAGIEEDSFQGAHWRAVVRFMEKLYQNDSLSSRESLFDFLRAFELTITADGDFIAYKGLLEDFTSINQGPGIVNGTSLKNAHLDNHPGNVVEIARSYVDNDRNAYCSTGLHAGSFDYASEFAQGKLVSVSINPRDVVSVPMDSGCQKLRVCRYTVLSEIPFEDSKKYDGFFYEDEESKNDESEESMCGCDCESCDEYSCGCEDFDEGIYGCEDGYDCISCDL